jgi:hypothetical protein
MFQDICNEAFSFYVNDSGGCCMDWLATTAFVKEAHHLSDSVNDGWHERPRKTHCHPVSADSPHIGHWIKASIKMNI